MPPPILTANEPLATLFLTSYILPVFLNGGCDDDRVGVRANVMSTQLIVLTGPESSGKTTLACQLADYWKASIVPEFAREYLAGKATYGEHDLLEIAKQQHQLEQDLMELSPEKIVCDTDLLVVMIWSEVKYGRCDSWIYETFKSNLERGDSSRNYYLCDSSIPWQDDPLRENPDNREELFDLYLQKIKEYGLAHEIVEGDPEKRFQQVLNSNL